MCAIGLEAEDKLKNFRFWRAFYATRELRRRNWPRFQKFCNTRNDDLNAGKVRFFTEENNTKLLPRFKVQTVENCTQYTTAFYSYALNHERCYFMSRPFKRVRFVEHSLFVMQSTDLNHKLYTLWKAYLKRSSILSLHLQFWVVFQRKLVTENLIKKIACHWHFLNWDHSNYELSRMIKLHGWK